MKQQEKFTPFYGGVFSQWYPSPMVIDGVEYSCAEQYMMAQKARLFGDEVALKAIMASCSPSEQKAIGKTVRGFKKWVWEAVAKDVVARGNLAKFTSTPELYDGLMETVGMRLVEASPTDVIWGIGLDQWDEDCTDPDKWRGTDWLGWVLTELRETLVYAKDAEYLME